MLRLYIPVAVVLAILGSLTYWESLYSSRWSESTMTAEEFGKRFAKLPKDVGDWHGEDQETDERTLEMAGAVNHVSRVYVNKVTNQRVDVWLIVGHSRDVCRHTPDICYVSHGFTMEGDKLKEHFEGAGEEDAVFYTARFRDEGDPKHPRRVFWAWNENDVEVNHKWEAPDNQRIHYGNNSALYKLYFTSTMDEEDEQIEESDAYIFGRMMLPIVNSTLFPEVYGDSAAAAAKAVEQSEAEAAKTPATGDPAKLDLPDSTVPSAQPEPSAVPAKPAEK